MREIRKLKDGAAYNWLMQFLLSQLYRHSFWEDAKTDHLTNNMTEPLNS